MELNQPLSEYVQKLLKSAMINPFDPNWCHQHFLGLKSYQSKRIIKKKIFRFLTNHHQVQIIREPVSIDRYHHISIQAGSHVNSYPKDDEGLYSMVEIGYPSFKLSPAFAKKYRLSSGVCGHVDVMDVINELSSLMIDFKRLKRKQEPRHVGYYKERPAKAKKTAKQNHN